MANLIILNEFEPDPAQTAESRVQHVRLRNSPRFTLVLPRTESLRSSAVSMAGAEHLGLGSIAAYLRSQGFPATQLNYQLSTFFNAWDGLEDPRDSYSAEDIAKEILATHPDVVGLCVTSMTLLQSLRVCEIIRAERPHCVLGLGGPHAILCHRELMDKFPVLDFIGMKDGERAMVLLGHALTRGVFPCSIPEMVTRSRTLDRGIMDMYRAMPKGVHDLPVPARDDLMWMLLRAPITECRITTSRGCNYDCTFCIDAMRYDRMWYARTAKQTVDEMEMLNRRLGIDHFWMSDDNFVTGAPSSQRRAREIADDLLARGLDLTYRVRFRSDTFLRDPSLLPRLAESGLVSAFVGLEAGSEEQLDRFKKRTTVHQHKQIVDEMRALGIALQCGFIMYEPYCSFADLEASATFLHEIQEMYLESNFTHALDVFPGTEIADEMKRDGLLHEGFDATSPYDAYDFADRDLGRLSKLIEQSHDSETVTRDKWLYRYRTNLLPRLYRKLRGHVDLAGWQRREEAVIRDLNEANMTFFMAAIDEARRHRCGERFFELRDNAWTAQRVGVAQLADLHREVATAAVDLPGRRRRTEGPRPAAPVRDSMSELVRQALMALPSDDYSVRELSGGMLNTVVHLTGSKAAYVMRVRKENDRRATVNYLRLLYEHAHMSELGGRFRLRTLDEEAAFIARLRAAGVRTPAVAAQGEEWLALEYVPGRPLAEELRDVGNPATVLRLLHQLMSAHRQGIILGDRWGYNEIVDPNGHLHFIDFDVEWTAAGDPAPLYAMEMGVALFGVLLNAARPDQLLETLREYGVPLLHEWGYPLTGIADVVRGYRSFYLDPDKPTLAVSLDVSEYRRLEEPLDQLLSLLTNETPGTTAVGHVD
ncbi:B12-binding domain-containing radical SAM protein [Micromonospora sp. C95]|uniref:B12-binding domain-containing radical SAM protein n=1 Tax=Micromonospora sp. C95 TaxID=2824882 RepID=UPI001B36ADAE|nr:radical SAM protein [Micromonospora sp. C95]MBQ1026039.1 radical SAM protein [Micromonospora sp. C95]